MGNWTRESCQDVRWFRKMSWRKADSSWLLLNALARLRCSRPSDRNFPCDEPQRCCVRQQYGEKHKRYSRSRHRSRRRIEINEEGGRCWRQGRRKETKRNIRQGQAAAEINDGGGSAYSALPNFDRRQDGLKLDDSVTQRNAT